MDDQSDEPMDGADLALVRALGEHARTEVHVLAARLGIPPRRVRERIRRLERRGVVHGFHAAAPAAAEGGALLVMLRFLGDGLPASAELCAIGGVRRVHVLSAGWDYMVEFGDGRAIAPRLAGADRGVAWILGRRAEFEVLSVREELPCPHADVLGRASSGSSPRTSS